MEAVSSYAMDIEDVVVEDGGLGSHLFAGAFAGIAEHVVMFPVDSIKTQMQVADALTCEKTGARLAPQRAPGMLSVARSMVRSGGALRLLRGAQSVAIGAGPAHALYFAMYEKARVVLGGDGEEHTPLAAAATGAAATTVCDTVMTPFDVVKQRLQMAGSPYRGMLDCFVKTARAEGMIAFFRSLPTTLVMNIPYAGFHFAAYESFSRILGGNDGEIHTPLANLGAGAAAGGLAAALTTPLDVVKTRLQTQATGGPELVRYTGLFQTFRTVLAEEGIRGFFVGAGPRIVFFAPGAAIAWTTYETLKHLTRHWSGSSSDDDRDDPE